MSLIGRAVGFLGGSKAYATWNPSDKHADISLSGGNLTATKTTATTWRGVRATLSKSSGKWYWEQTYSANVYSTIGVGCAESDITGRLGVGATDYAWLGSGNKYNNNVSATFSGTTYGAGDVVGVGLDMDAGTIGFWKNNVAIGQAYTGISGTQFPAISLYDNNDALTANFGASAMAYTAPPVTTYDPATGPASVSYTAQGLTLTSSADTPKTVRTTTSKASGKWYAEYTCTTIGTYDMVGICKAACDKDTSAGNDANGWAYYNFNGNKMNNASGVSYGATYTTGDKIGIAVDLDNGKLFFSKNGTWQNSGNPATGANPAYSSLSGTFFLCSSPYSNGNVVTLNTGVSAFTYSVPSGFSAWDSTNYNQGVWYQSPFVGFSATYTTTGTQTVPIPMGASTVTVECYAAGGSGNARGANYCGGGGAAYSKKNTYSVAGLTGIYISVPAIPGYDASGADAFAKENSSGGTTICLAKGGECQQDQNAAGGAAASGTGDVKYSGGTGYMHGTNANSAGGGAAGPNGNGGNASSATGGTANGGLSGAGGVNTATGFNYGGGGGGWDPTGFGAQGVIKLTWA